MKSLILILSLIFFFPGVLIADVKSFTGRVVGVIDGDTIEVMEKGRTVTVRLNGIDCPEKGDPYSKKAREYVYKKAFKREVRIVGLKKDKYGRLVADVIFKSGNHLSHLLVGQGLCFWYKQFSPYDFKLKILEAEAKRKKKGIWLMENPRPPWEKKRGRGG